MTAQGGNGDTGAQLAEMGPDYDDDDDDYYDYDYDYGERNPWDPQSNSALVF